MKIWSAQLAKYPLSASARMLDLGCGSGELTSLAHERFIAPAGGSTLGVDSSASMLSKCFSFANDALNFRQETFDSQLAHDESFDVIISNAALHWADDQELIYRQIESRLNEGGHLLVQIPNNQNHFSQTCVLQIIQQEPFQQELNGWSRPSVVQSPEWYTSLLYRLGFEDQLVRTHIYPHVMLNGYVDVAEWCKGSTLTPYVNRMSQQTYSKFVERYTETLAGEIKEKPYLFTFNRIFLWARKAARK